MNSRVFELCFVHASTAVATTMTLCWGLTRCGMVVLGLLIALREPVTYRGPPVPYVKDWEM